MRSFSVRRWKSIEGENQNLMFEWFWCSVLEITKRDVVTNNDIVDVDH